MKEWILESMLNIDEVNDNNSSKNHKNQHFSSDLSPKNNTQSPDESYNIQHNDLIAFIKKNDKNKIDHLFSHTLVRDIKDNSMGSVLSETDKISSRSIGTWLSIEDEKLLNYSSSDDKEDSTHGNEGIWDSKNVRLQEEFRTLSGRKITAFSDIYNFQNPSLY